jgi:hypothetical protein
MSKPRGEEIIPPMSTECTVKYDKMEEENRKRGKCERKRSKEEH